MVEDNVSTLYDDCIVIDALNYFPQFTGDYLQTMHEAGVTAIHATLPNQSPAPPTFVQATEKLLTMERIIEKNSDKAIVATKLAISSAVRKTGRSRSSQDPRMRPS